MSGCFVDSEGAGLYDTVLDAHVRYYEASHTHREQLALFTPETGRDQSSEESRNLTEATQGENSA